MAPAVDEVRQDTNMALSLGKENGIAPEVPEKNRVNCASYYQDLHSRVETLRDESQPSNGSDDAEVDIIECGKSDEKALIEGECRDTTEQSSSFGDTDSAAGSSDNEVESRMHDDGASMLAFDGCGDLFKKRRKKLTPHWRKFIRPLMWRCKWLELHIKELQSQAANYGRELAECNKKKHSEVDKTGAEDLAVKSMPYISKNHRVNVLRRKKRKRVEEVIDVPSYVREHNVFEYLANRKSYFPDFAYIEDDDGNNSVVPFDKGKSENDALILNGEWPSLKFENGENAEDILRRMEAAQLQVHLLRTRMGKVFSQNAGKFASSDTTSFPAPQALTRTGPTSVHVDGTKFPGRTLYTTSQHTSENRMGDLIMPESAVSSHSEVTPLPDMIESTDQPQAGMSCLKVESGIVPYEKPKEPFPDAEVKTIAPPQGSAKSGPSGKTNMFQEQPNGKARSISNMIAKKRKGRRARSNIRWNRKLSMQQN